MKKKILLLAAVLAVAGCEAQPVLADSPVLDQFSVALLGHTETVLESTIHGKTNGEVLVTPFQIGKIDGGYLAGIDFGVAGNVKPSVLGQQGFDWTTGVHLHLSPLIRDVAPKISPNFPALAALEVNPRVSFPRLFNHGADRKTLPKVEVGLGIGWSWSATPQP